MNVRDIIQERIGSSGKLLYLTKFGSHLYGTNTLNSDTDYKGLFMPSYKALYSFNAPRSISYSSGNDHSKNTVNDTDIQLWSIQYWLQLLRTGDTNAIDLLYSFTASHADSLDQYVDEELKKAISSVVGERLVDLVDLRNNKAYIAYAYKQAKKYGLKGSRMSILEKVRNFVVATMEMDQIGDEKFGMLFDDILSRFEDKSYCFSKECNGQPHLWILGKGYSSTITIAEAASRLDKAWATYGDRARQAKENSGIDWKAVSHACRCIYQVLELAKTGDLKYPLHYAPYLVDIKCGRMEWSTQVEPTIVVLLDKASEIITNVPVNKKMDTYHQQILDYLYGGENGKQS